MTMPRFQTHTVESFLDWWEGREGRYELHQGVIAPMAPPSFFHQKIVSLLHEVFYEHFRKSGREVLILQGSGFSINDTSHLVPDMSLYAADNLPEGLHSRNPGHAFPSLVIEVLSPSTRRVDLGQKREFYAQAGIPEYWIVDPEAQTFTFLRLADGAYGESALVGSIYETPLLLGFRLNTETFWEDV